MLSLATAATAATEEPKNETLVLPDSAVFTWRNEEKQREHDAAGFEEGGNSSLASGERTG